MTESNTALREALHRAIDDVLDSFENGHGGSPADAVTVVAGVEQGPWTYRWPDGVIEPFSHGRWYKVSGGRGDAEGSGRLLDGHRHRVLHSLQRSRRWRGRR